MPNIAIAILAAGASTRMGQSKQKLLYKGQALLSLAVSAAWGTSCRPIVVVSNASDTCDVSDFVSISGIKESAQDLEILKNENSPEGMSSSIKLATRHVVENPNVDALLFMNCDQPFISPGSLQTLISNFKQGSIVASRINNTVGSPAIFDRCFFDDLLMLEGDKGGKGIIRKYSEKVIGVVVQGADFDVDTPDDYTCLIEQA